MNKTKKVRITNLPTYRTWYKRIGEVFEVAETPYCRDGMGYYTVVADGRLIDPQNCEEVRDV